MANIKSAKKRINVINRRTAENRLIKTALSTEIKKYHKELDAKEFEKAYAHIPALVTQINEACSRGVIHQNNASRKVAKLYLSYNRAAKGVDYAPEVKVEPKAEVEVKAEPKSEKETAKKPAKKATKEVEAKTEETKKAPAKKAAKAAPKKEAKAEEKKAAKSAPKAKAAPKKEAAPKAKAETKTAPKAKAETKAKAEPKATPKAKTAKTTAKKASK